MRKKMQQLLTIVLLLTLLIFPVSSSVEAEDKSERDSLIIAIESEPGSLSTVDNDSLSPIYFHLLTNNLLFKVDMETLDVEPDLVESYEQPSDTEWVFKLREGVKFHHGKELKAEDVVASINNAKEYPGSRNYTEQIETVEALDDYTVKIVTPQPYANLLYDLAYHFNYIIPGDLLEEGHDFTQHPVGTGPYKFVEWRKGQDITLEINEEYFDEEEQPTIKTIIFRFIPEGTSRTMALETGEVDVVFHVEPADVERLMENEDIQVDRLMSVENKYLVINNALPPFDDPNLRLAIHCAIDREAVVEGALNGYAVPNYTSIAMGYWGSWEGNAKPYDVELAKEYLEKWGGNPADVKFPIIARTDLEGRIATIIQANLYEIGIMAEVVNMETATYHERRAAGDYTAAITSWSPSNSFTYMMRYHSDKNLAIPGSCNDPEVDRLIAEMKAEMDDDKRLEIIHELVELVNDVCPQPSLYQEEYFRAYNADLEGIVCAPTGYMKFHTAKWTK